MTKYTDEASVFKNALDSSYQETLVSGTNISTINGQSLLNGGDLVVGGASTGTFTDLQTLITNASSGGTIILDKDYKYDSTIDSGILNGIRISKNITIIGNGHIIDGNDGKRAFIINGQYTLNLSDLRIQNCSNSNNYGGAIYARKNATINITNTQFSKNNATETYGHGGAIYVDSATVNINNTTFTKNTATSNGGAIHATSSATVNITNTTFNQNNANYGGAIYATNSQLIIKESVIKNNTASTRANIYCNTATTVYNCEINDISTTCYNVTNKNYVIES